MSDRTPILEAKRRLPLPDLMAKLGLAEHAKKSAKCFMHEDGNNSFSVWEYNPGSWHWKCHAGCGEGDEITLLEKVKGIGRKEAIRLFLEMAGIQPEKQSAPAHKLFGWTKPCSGFVTNFAPLVAKERGYSLEFVLWLHDKHLIGTHKSCIAFPNHDADGNVVSVHYKNAGKWMYDPKGHPTAPLVFGDTVTPQAYFVFESQWDAFAVADKFEEHKPGAEAARFAYIVTRGAGNGKLVKGLIPADAVAWAWKQNDPEKNGKRAGDEWLKEVIANTDATVVWVETPEPHKDVNDWTRVGATAEDLFAAVKVAREMPKTKPEENSKTFSQLAVTPSPEPIPVFRSLDELLTEVHKFLCDFVVFPKNEQAVVVTLWIAHTWVLEAFTFTPYLAINSPVKRCGKSTLLDCLKLLVKVSWLVVTPSPAVLFRKIERDCPTLLLDEVDTIFSAAKGDDGKEELRAVLNAGFQRGAKVSRCVGPNFDLKDFAVFCPKALAGIGKLPDTVADRSLPVVLARKGKGDTVQKFRHRDVADRARELQESLAGWAQDPSVIPALTAARPAVPAELGDRVADISEPLLALADLAGGDWPDVTRDAVVKLTTGKGSEDDNLPIKLLMACREIFAKLDCDELSSAELLQALIDREDDAPWASWWETDVSNGRTKGPAGRLARMLKPFDVCSKTLRQGKDTRKGYSLDTFKPAFLRYLPDSTK